MAGFLDMPVFTPETAVLNGRKSGQSKGPTALRDAVDLQALLIRDAKSEEVTPAQRAQIARSWCDLEEAKRKLKMRPLPGSLKPSAPRPKRKTVASGPIEPEQPAAPQPAETEQDKPA
jgi:hypothetical protein